VRVISLNQRSNRVFIDYVRGFIKSSRFLRNEVERETEHEIHLKNGVVIAGYPCTNASARGLTIKTFVMDEACFFRQSGVTTDLEVFRAVRPAMASIPTSRFFILSSPYVKQGLVWDLYREYFGVDSDFLTVLQAPSSLMNPTIDEKFLRQEQEADPEAYRREFLAEFIDSISCLFTPEAIRNCIMEGEVEIGQRSGRQHSAFFDGASGGPGGDSAALGVAARTVDGQADLLCCREWVPPFSPSAVVAECAEILRSYGLSLVTSDRYSPGWCAEAFSKAGIQFRASDKTKSDIYREAIGPTNSGRVRLLDNKKLIEQLASLERRVARGSGLETIDHPIGAHQHDDLANVACGCLTLALKQSNVGLLEFYKQEADRVRAQEQGVPKPPIVASGSPEPPTLEQSGEAQRQALGDPRLPDGTKISKTLLPRKPLPVCPQCGTTRAVYSESWKCFSCGASGPNEPQSEVYTTTTQEVVS
jgi:hypothetical protein